VVCDKIKKEMDVTRPLERERLGTYLRLLRRSKGLSQQQVTDRCREQFDTRSLIRWEQGQVIPKREKLHALLGVLKATSEQSELAYRLAGDVKSLVQWRNDNDLWTPLLGDVIRTARLAKGWSEKELAACVKTSASNLSYYENNRRFPKDEVLRSLEKVLGIDLSEEQIFPTTLRQSLESLDEAGWEQHLADLQNRVLSAPHDFAGYLVLPCYYTILLQYRMRQPRSWLPMARLLQLWAEWSLTQGDFPTLGHIGHRMTNIPVSWPVGVTPLPKIGKTVTNTDGTTITDEIATEVFRGHLYVARAEMQNRHFTSSLKILCSLEPPHSDKRSVDYCKAYAQLLRDRARLHMEIGLHEKAIEESSQALRYAEESAERRTWDYTQLITARVLVSSSTSMAVRDRAMRFLPAIPERATDPSTELTYLLGHAQVQLALGQKNHVSSLLEKANKIAITHHLPYRLSQIQELFRQL
jgi:transcriptional regulator with XRE-family HTH domain